MKRLGSRNGTLPGSDPVAAARLREVVETASPVVQLNRIGSRLLRLMICHSNLRDKAPQVKARITTRLKRQLVHIFSNSITCNVDLNCQEFNTRS